MRQTFLAIGIGLVVLLGFYFISPSGAAQKAARTQWEYASIKAAYTFEPQKDRLNKIYGMAEVCYLQPNGCKRLEIKHEFDYGSFLQERGLAENFDTRKQASLSAGEIAFQKAMAQLGTEGWEIISDPDLPIEFVTIDDYNKYENKSHLFTRHNTQAVYFKRLKTQ